MGINVRRSKVSLMGIVRLERFSLNPFRSSDVPEVAPSCGEWWRRLEEEKGGPPWDGHQVK
jgi:hypothetical protein